MEKINHTDEKGRKYSAFSNGEGNVIIIGPPEDLVDSMGLPEPFATNLHNALFSRNIFTYSDACKARNGLVGVIQEIMLVDAQKLLEAFSKYDQH